MPFFYIKLLFFPTSHSVIFSYIPLNVSWKKSKMSDTIYTQTWFCCVTNKQKSVRVGLGFPFLDHTNLKHSFSLILCLSVNMCSFGMSCHKHVSNMLKPGWQKTGGVVECLNTWGLFTKSCFNSLCCFLNYGLPDPPHQSFETNKQLSWK